MAKDREEELERLEKELLSDVHIEVFDTLPGQPEDAVPEEDLTITPEDLADYPETPILAEPQERRKKTAAARRRDDKWLIVLMLIASVLCLSIIGFLIYWLEFFFN